MSIIAISIGSTSRHSSTGTSMIETLLPKSKYPLIQSLQHPLYCQARLAVDWVLTVDPNSIYSSCLNHCTSYYSTFLTSTTTCGVDTLLWWESTITQGRDVNTMTDTPASVSENYRPLPGCCSGCHIFADAVRLIY